MKWLRSCDLNFSNSYDQETWIRKGECGISEFPMDIYLGKKTDILHLKKNLVESLREQLKYFSDTRRKVYGKPLNEMVYVSHCPITGIPTEKTKPVYCIYGAEYVQTPDTGHVFLKYIPSQPSIYNFYLSDVNYASTYTDKENAEKRLQSIAVPWAEWVVKVYEKQYHQKPKTILDVGSGAGHFVEACRRLGIHADGIELSESSRTFAQKMWGFDLDNRRFETLNGEYDGYDIITFWGLLEHTPNPKQIVQKAVDFTSKSKTGGMVIAKLPRWVSLSSAVQRLSLETVIRHIDPMGHLMIFTDASAAELFYISNLKPIAAWYYGMDVYELLMQIGNQIDDYSALMKTNSTQIELQQYVDENRFCDGLTLVGIPNTDSYE